MTISYCEGWFRARKIVSKPLTEAQARQRHSTKGALYTAVLGDPVRPHTFVEIVSDDSIQVEFLDEQLRSHSAYQFVIQPDGCLFMVMAVFREFATGTKGAVFGESLHFKSDGHVLSIEEDFRTKVVTRAERYIDVSLHWEPYPAFGDYASIARFDRDRPPTLPAEVKSGSD